MQFNTIKKSDVLPLTDTVYFLGINEKEMKNTFYIHVASIKLIWGKAVQV